MIQRVLGVLLVVGIFGGLLAYSQFRPQPDYVSGFVEADEIRVGSRVGGRVLAVHVVEGEPIGEGDVLLDLEPFDLKARANEARQMLAARQAEFDRVQAGLRDEEVAQARSRYEQFLARQELLEAGPREQEVSAAQARLRAATAERTLAQQNYDRAAELVETDSIPREQFDKAVGELEAAQAMLDVRTNELELLEAGTRTEEIREAQARTEEAHQAWLAAREGSRQEDIDAARAARDAAAATVEAIDEQLKELRLRSPVDGLVEALDLQPGDLVPPGAPVVSVMDTDRLWVRAFVPQNRLGLRVGDRLWVSTGDAAKDRIQGEIVFISRQAEFTPSNVQTPEERAKQVFRIKVALPADVEYLRPGMTVDVGLEPIAE